MRRDDIAEKLKELRKDPKATIDFKPGDTVQIKALENKRKKGEPVFIREDGKIGFPTINSVAFKIGDTVKGNVTRDADTYFMVQITEVVSN